MLTITTARSSYLLFSVIFITACTPLSATTLEKPADKVATSQTANKNRERAIQQWIDARAAYEKSLDYSSLELENEYKYKTMRTLVEAKYFLMLAEKDLQYNTDKSVALDDFNQARQLLEKAKTAAGAGDRQKIDSIHEQLDEMRLAVKRDMTSEARWLPIDQRSKFDTVLAQLEDIIRRQ